MEAILETVERPQCEGRLTPSRLFDAIDTLGSMLEGHPSPAGHRSPPQLADWKDVICEFGRYYQLSGAGPICVDATAWKEISQRYIR
jgi:hypothetical protein